MDVKVQDAKTMNLKESEIIHIAIVTSTYTDVAGYPTESFKKIAEDSKNREL